jgi:outer membrane lipoprotein-sorting protein
MKLLYIFSAVVFFLNASSATQPVYTGEDLAADVIHNALLRQSEITNLKGDVRLTYTTGGDSQTFRVGFARVPPGEARLEIMGLLGEVLFVLTADGDRMMVHNKTERKAVVCNANRENLSTLLGMDLGGDIFRVLDWIEGRAPVYVDKVTTGEMSAFGEENDDGTVTITWKSRGSDVPVQVLTFDPGDGRVLFSRVFDADGQAETDIHYEDFADCGGILVSFSVGVKRKDVFLDVEFNSVKINDKIKDKAFSVEPPKGTEVFYWDGLSGEKDG